jgi:hypothetical protein
MPVLLPLRTQKPYQAPAKCHCQVCAEYRNVMFVSPQLELQTRETKEQSSYNSHVEEGMDESSAVCLSLLMIFHNGVTTGIVAFLSI